ncbi:MAG: hypothetical protein AAF565_08465 [Pseudomonadota bacterium]
MPYVIPADVLPGSRPRLIAPAITIMAVSFAASALLGFVWAGLNAVFLGCRDARRQWAVLAAGFVAVKGAHLAALWLREVGDADSLPALGADLLGTLSVFLGIGVIIYLFDRQQLLYGFHSRARWKLYGIPAAIGLFALSLVLRGAVPDDMPALKLLLGGVLGGG